MELKLVVVEGAKQGLEIPLKKDKFLIGRAKECALRAGSEAISRRHCAILHVKGVWAVRDLGSRNGTYVNDKRIEKPVRLNPGDELRVGPLKFRVSSMSAAAPGADSSSTSTPASKSRKKPPVKDVGDAVQRTMGKSSSDTATEDDICRWLLGPDAEDATLKETRTIRLEETATHSRIPLPSGPPAENVPATEGDADEAVASAAEPPEDAEDNDDEKSGAWGLFKLGKGTPKKKPGKLPPRPEQANKNSREAAADILREMTRRR